MKKEITAVFHTTHNAPSSPPGPLKQQSTFQYSENAETCIEQYTEDVVKRRDSSQRYTKYLLSSIAFVQCWWHLKIFTFTITPALSILFLRPTEQRACRAETPFSSALRWTSFPSLGEGQQARYIATVQTRVQRVYYNMHSGSIRILGISRTL